MKQLKLDKTLGLLSRIMEFELAGVVRYTHYSLMVTGPNRIPIVQFMKAQAAESLLHAQQAGELLTGLGGHPTLQIAKIDETHRHSVKDILEESTYHEGRALALYKDLLQVVQDRSVYLEEFARTQIAAEEMHSLELRKMLRDIGVTTGLAPMTALRDHHDPHKDRDHRDDKDHDDTAKKRSAAPPKKAAARTKRKGKTAKPG
jgi:bacterioferritin